VQQSNAYVIGFAAALTVVLGGLLSLAAVGLKEKQKEAVILETKKQILSAVMPVEGRSKLDLAQVYDKRIKSIVVNYDGKEVTENANGNPIVPEDVNISKEYKKSPEERLYPVFMFVSENDPNNVESYILPVYGFGLWDFIWGYLALEGDLATVKGVSFDHKAETPGLGARITDAEIQARFQGKKMLDESGQVKAVRMLKGEQNSNLSAHEVNGMSGATITANGVNDMLRNYMEYYKSYFKSIDKKAS